MPAGAHDGRPDTLLGESQVLVGIEPAIIDGELAVRVLEHPGNREDPAGARRQCGTPMRALAGMRALGPCSHQQEPLCFWFCIGVMRGSAVGWEVNLAGVVRSCVALPSSPFLVSVWTRSPT